jgi:hypothetical protein
MILGVLLILSTIVSPVEPGASRAAFLAGEYVRSDGFLHERLTLAASSSSFTYVELGCVGGPTKYEGKARLTPDSVSISGRHGSLEQEFVVIVWSERHYLVPRTRIRAFCAYASGTTMEEPVPFFIRVEDQSKAVPSAEERPSQCR